MIETMLVIGRGGREHALAWKLAQSSRTARVWVAPGNGGTALAGGKVANVGLQETDFSGLIDFARRNGVTLAVVGPEAPLADGIVDAFQAAGLRCFGPSQAAAQIEASKAFAKDFMARVDNMGIGFYTHLLGYAQPKMSNYESIDDLFS